MTVVALTAIGVGSATAVGALIGFFTGKISENGRNAVMGFAAGMMLAAACVGLVIPAVDLTGLKGLWQVALGFFAGAAFLNLADRLMPHAHTDKLTRKAGLFVAAIAIHNFPEGLASGVGFATGNTGGAIALALGIALQNIPEGMIIIAPLMFSGMKKSKALIISMCTGLFEVAGTFIGYFAASASRIMLPFSLSFAAGMMIFVIADEMIPETHSGENGLISSFALVAGFMLMLLLDCVF